MGNLSDNEEVRDAVADKIRETNWGTPIVLDQGQGLVGILGNCYTDPEECDADGPGPQRSA